MALAPAPISRTWTGTPAHLHGEPEHAGIGAHQLLVLGLGDQHGVGPVAAQMGHQRAVAGGFLLDHRLDRHGGGRLQAEAGAARRGRTGWRRGRPSCRRRRGHTASRPRSPGRRADGSTGRGAPAAPRRHGPAGSASARSRCSAGGWQTTIGASECCASSIFEPPGWAAMAAPIHGEALRGVAAGAELLEHVVLAGVLLPAQGREPDQRLRVGDLIGKPLRHGGFDLGGEGGVEGHGNSEPSAAGRKRPGSGGCQPAVVASMARAADPAQAAPLRCGGGQPAARPISKA